MEKFNVYRISMIKEKSIDYQAQVSNSRQAAEVARKTITECGQGDREQMVVLMLDIRNQIIGANIVSVGSVSGSFVGLREILKPVILANSIAMIIAHNHPSGNLKPSQEDNEITKRIFIGAHLLGITLHDHLIVNIFENERYYSYSENNILEKYKKKCFLKLKEF